MKEQRNYDVPRPMPSCELAEIVQQDVCTPAIHLQGSLLEETAHEKGGFGLLVPSPRHAFQPTFALPMFFGVTCEVNSEARESHHFHPHQVEVYCMAKGVVRMQTWLGLSEREFILRAGDALIVPPGSCHHLCEWLQRGVCYVFRSPNDITGDAAKVQCDADHQCQRECIKLVGHRNGQREFRRSRS
jgi:hypothetical protein